MIRTTPRSSRALGESSRLFKTAHPRRLLSAFLQIVVLAVNLFGWTLAPVSEAAARPASGVVAEMSADTDICEHTAGPQSSHGTSHDKMSCPACFPLGNASSGALAAVAVAVPAPFAPVVGRQCLPDDRSASSAFPPFQYQARAPPLTA
ncbi:MAG TPA: DUF2946 family protein [Patescibacteria group bacterium]|nr:DUF2946 family protein [Patescibacteria group bacterium]